MKGRSSAAVLSVLGLLVVAAGCGSGSGATSPDATTTTTAGGAGTATAVQQGARDQKGGDGETDLEKRNESAAQRESFTPPTYLPGVAFDHRYTEPTSYPFSADGDLTGKDLVWEGWGGQVATASGKLFERRYLSDEPIAYAGAVVASGLERCDGSAYYTEVEAQLPADAAFQPEGQPFRTATPCSSGQSTEGREGTSSPRRGSRTSTVGFAMPSGNIVCLLSGRGVECEIFHRTYRPYIPRPSSCPEDYGSRLSVEVGGISRFDCYGDTLRGVDDDHVLPYGNEIRRGSVSCTSRESGISCEDRAGAGFFLSIQRAKLF